MICRYCGASDYYEPVNICRCGRSGSWVPPYAPDLLPCSDAELNARPFVKAIRRWRYGLFPANTAIIADALRRAATDQPENPQTDQSKEG